MLSLYSRLCVALISPSYYSDIYANLTNGALIVAWAKLSETSAQIELFDPLGRPIQTRLLTKGSSGAQITFSPLPPGPYTYLLTTPGGDAHRGLLIFID